MKKVLIVTPHWPPILAPDMQRVRIVLPFLKRFGWEPLILKINPCESESVKDEELAKSLPQDTKTWQANCIPKKWVRWVGLNNASLRSFFHLAHLGSQIIGREKPELIFFSTTMFPLMALGRYWHFRHHVPYILDFQDPWYYDYDPQSGGKPPGGHLKYGICNFLAKYLEPFSLRKACHILTVSPSYPEMFLARYPWLTEKQFTVLPFGAAKEDFDHVRNASIANPFFRRDEHEHWVYVGCINASMDFTLRAFFMALTHQREQKPDLFSKIRLHFIGTDYAPPSRASKKVEPLAKEYRLEEIVQESPYRIPYFQALQCLLDSDALIVPGSEDPGYTASKIFPYILAHKPLLAIFHERSSVVEILKKTKAGIVVPFSTEDNGLRVSEEIERVWFSSGSLPQPNTDWQAFEPYTAQTMAQQLGCVFDYSFVALSKEDNT